MILIHLFLDMLEGTNAHVIVWLDLLELMDPQLAMSLIAMLVD